MAVIAAMLGLIFVAGAIYVMITVPVLVGDALAGMYFLYGSLAAYFGVKDTISVLQSSDHKSTGSITNENEVVEKD